MKRIIFYVCLSIGLVVITTAIIALSPISTEMVSQIVLSTPISASNPTIVITPTPMIFLESDFGEHDMARYFTDAYALAQIAPYCYRISEEDAEKYRDTFFNGEGVPDNWLIKKFEKDTGLKVGIYGIKETKKGDVYVEEIYSDPDPSKIFDQMFIEEFLKGSGPPYTYPEGYCLVFDMELGYNWGGDGYGHRTYFYNHDLLLTWVEYGT